MCINSIDKTDHFARKYERHLSTQGLELCPHCLDNLDFAEREKVMKAGKPPEWSDPSPEHLSPFTGCNCKMLSWRTRLNPA